MFAYTHRVTYADCTVGNHIYYGRYLDLLEAARGEFFRHLGTPLSQWQEQDALFPVVECRLQYRQQAHYDEILKIELWPTFCQGVRLNFGYRILNQAGQLVLEGETFHACTTVSGKPRRLPERLCQTLAAPPPSAVPTANPTLR